MVYKLLRMRYLKDLRDCGEGEFDLDRESRRALEFDELLDWVASYARTGPGHTRLLALKPSGDPYLVGAQLDAVEEMRALLADEGKLIPGELPDPAEAIAALAYEGMRLPAAELRNIAELLLAVAGLRGLLSRLDRESHPHLERLGQALPDLSTEARDINSCIEPDGSISDDASVELRRIRSSRAKVGDRLRRMLEAYLHDPEAGAVVQDDFITQRNGRFVIPLRVDAPRPVRGIVHATSSSGATRFVEPMDSVDLNNELVRLGEEEREEQDRLLLGWSEMLRVHLEEVVQASEGLAELDSIQARALFAEECDAVRPAVEEGGPLVFGSLRHPLLERRLREEGGGCVPLSLGLDPFDQALVLSGPNTGGKTVALKTFGLAVLMAQSGIPVPAAEVRLPLFGQLRADIGDHQSIEANLSTYSAHISSVIDFLRAARPPALFLFDEIGGGTEPIEGGALAQSILEALLQPGMTTVATTHQEALKGWAFTTDRATSAAMEFDAESLRPTYRILMGAAGVSAGLDIAARLGLDPEIIRTARAHLGDEKRRSEDYLERLRKLTVELEEKRSGVARMEEELVEQRRRLEARASHEEDNRRRHVESELERALEEFKELAGRELAAIRDKLERKRAQRDMGKLEGRLRMERRRRVDELAPAAGGGGAGVPIGPEELREGMQVYVRSLAKSGRVHEIRGERVEVLLGRSIFTVERSDLRAEPRGGEHSRRPERPGLSTLRAATEAPLEIKLLGMTVDEALPAVDKFLDDAVLAGHSEVRVVHGHGTGRLRDAVRKYLLSHIHVAGHRAGRAGEGGDGATVVKLKQD
jgi:DNA mismatch repair protein MutS2